MVSSPELATVATIIASSIAAETVTPKGWGVASMTMSTPRLASSASWPSEMPELMTVLPARSSSPNPSSSS